MKFSIITFLSFLFYTTNCFSQNKLEDSQVLSPEDFVAIVKTFHPVIKQADINIEKAQADITIARGGFDPSLYYYNCLLYTSPSPRD